MQEIFVIGDLELGGGTRGDDFISDRALSNFVLSLAKKKNPVDLVVNGDGFDFLKCPYQVKPNKHTRYVTENISLKKLELMYQAHKRVFEAYKKFARKHHIYFVRGNHDQDIVFPGVQKRLRELIGDNIHFPGLSYSKKGVYAEHGQQLDEQNKISTDFLKYRKKRILNQSFVSFAILNNLVKFKEKYAFFERIRPTPPLLKHHPKIRKGMCRRLFLHMLKSVFYYPWRYPTNPTYTIPFNWMSVVIQRFREQEWEPEVIIPRFKQKRKDIIAKHHICVLGHVHRVAIDEIGTTVIIQPDMWRDEYNFDVKKMKLIPKQKNYVHITIRDNRAPEWKLVPYPIKRSVLSFHKVRADPEKYRHLAELEEGYRNV